MHLRSLILIILGGVMEGLFALPMRFAPRWSWENFWGTGSFFALILVPWPLAILTVPALRSVYMEAPPPAIFLAILFGAGWGLGGVFFGRGVALLGLSLGTSIIMGLIAISGSVLPLVLKRNVHIPTGALGGLLAGITIMLCGLGLCAFAGNLRSDSVKRATDSRTPHFSFGILYCIAAGTLSSLVNFALIFGDPIASVATSHNIDRSIANNAVWAIVFSANYIVNIGYCLSLAWKRHTLYELRSESRRHYWLLAVLMGFLWGGGIVVYGLGASTGDTLGPVFGFPIMLLASILTGNVAGAICGEWRLQPASATLAMGCGLLFMVLAIVTLGYANYKVA